MESELAATPIIALLALIVGAPLARSGGGCRRRTGDRYWLGCVRGRRPSGTYQEPRTR